MPDVPSDDRPPRGDGLSRRSFLGGAGGVAAARALGTSLEAETRTLAATQSERLTGELEIELMINGTRQRLTVEPRTTLLDALRWHMQTPLTGTKEVCDRAACGACTVIVDGRTAYACTQLAVDFLGREITTVEGLGQPDNLSPVQQAFCEKDALMCGFCTPGFVVSVTNTLARQPAADLAAIRAGCAGNVCRCGTYPHIFEAALAARDAGSGRANDEGGDQ